MTPRSHRAYWAALLLVAAALAVLAAISHAPTFAGVEYAIQRTPTLTPSSLALPEAERARDGATVSLYLRSRDLHHPDTGILANVTKHGRAWERPGWVSFLEGGRVTYSTQVGVRVHGGGSRLANQPQSFRIFARRKYGAREIPRGVAFDGNHRHPLRRLVLHNDMRVTDDGMRWHFVNPLAYDIAHAAGAVTPATRPVRFFLNGELQGVYVLTEHFDPEDYFETHWRHALHLKNAEFDELWQQIQAMQPLTMDRVGELVDLENLTRWFIPIVFCNTRDPFQGPGQFRDPTRPRAQWIFVNWDMDQSFRVVEADSFVGLLEKPGQRRGRRDNEPRPRIMTALLTGDAEYRAYFARVWVDIMNHRLTPAFLRERYDHYAELAVELGVPDLEYLTPLREFLEARRPIVRAQAERWLQTGPSVRVRLVGRGGPIEIDGHQIRPGWEGYYFPGMEISLRVPDDGRATFGGWRVNGGEHADPDLTLTAREDIDVEVMSRQRAQ